MSMPWLSHADLMREWLGMIDVNSVQHQRLEAVGVCREAITVAGGMAWCRVRVHGRTFTPVNTGDVFFIMPVWATAAPSIYEAVEQPILADLIAWQLDEPTRWYYRLGASGAVLGADNLDEAHAGGSAIVLHTTPLSWLAAGCQGSVLLEATEAGWRNQEAADKGEADLAWWHGGSPAA